MRTICNVVSGPAEGHGIPGIGQSEPGRPGAPSAHMRTADPPLDVAIRVDGEVSPHI